MQLTHRPSGISIRSESGRSQKQNKRIALERLRERLIAANRTAAATARAAERRGQVGSGMRGDKRRTIRVQDDSVVDHVTGRCWKFRDYIRGDW